MGGQVVRAPGSSLLGKKISQAGGHSLRSLPADMESFQWCKQTVTGARMLVLAGRLEACQPGAELSRTGLSSLCVSVCLRWLQLYLNPLFVAAPIVAVSFLITG